MKTSSISGVWPCNQDNKDGRGWKAWCTRGTGRRQEAREGGGAPSCQWSPHCWSILDGKRIESGWWSWWRLQARIGPGMGKAVVARLTQSTPVEALIGGRDLLIVPTCSRVTSHECGHWTCFLVVSWCFFQQLWFLIEAFLVTSKITPHISHIHSVTSIPPPGDTDVLIMGCCVTNDPNTEALKNLSHRVCGSGIQVWLS